MKSNLTGTDFVIVSEQISVFRQGIGIKNSPKFFAKSQDSPAASSYEDYITRHVSVKHKDPIHEETRVSRI